ncbi:MAG: tetratricopeptide repeat protein [Planctomycetes bacterium]|nr:tetratricopeptide repeat protein [Planctomycetota bacterium]
MIRGRPRSIFILAALAAACACDRSQGAAATQPASAPAGSVPAALRDRVDAQIETIQKCILRGQFSEALSKLAPLSAEYPGEIRILELRALARLQIHQFSEARDDFLKLTNIRKGDVPALIGLARAEEMLGNLDAAALALAHALDLEPSNPNVLYSAGQVASRRHDDANARALLTKALGLRPWSDSAPSAHYVLSQIASRRGDATAAAEHERLYTITFKWAEHRSALEKLLQTDPGDAAARRGLASLYLEAGDGKTAAGFLGPLVRESPRDPKLRLLFAHAQELAGDIPGAFASDAEALRLDPSSISARRHRARLFILTKDLERALEELKDAVARDPGATVDPALPDVAVQLAAAARAASKASIAAEAAQIAKAFGK